ncbi:MAG TPA: cobalt transport protein CbiN [Blastocatellia bacterium]|nr:cobalt transport protein CbiN [Blastocatellia bacterium]
MKRREKLILTVLLIVLVSPFVMKRLGWLDSFVGTDNQAQTMIGRIRPDYRPWFGSVFTPGEHEEWLFALQAAIGAGVFGYCLIKLRARRKTGDRGRSR